MPKRPPDSDAFLNPYRAPAREKAKPKVKRAKVGDEDHLDFIRALPCCVCKAHGGDPHHLMRVPLPFKQHGIGQKTDDCFALPMCRKHHNELHTNIEHVFGNETLWFGSRWINNPPGLALALWAISGMDATETEKYERATAIMGLS